MERHLTAALLALLEHSDRSVLSGLLERAGLGGPSLDDAEFLYPAPGGPPGTGEIRSPHRRVRVAAVEPGGEFQPGPDGGVSTLVISMTGKAPPGLVGLSWEQVDRWLAGVAERYDPESRTGFLLRQFRAYLPEVGIAYFAGFRSEQLERAPEALTQLTGFYREAGSLFDRLGTALPEGLAEVRQARPEDLLVGFCYRDYSGVSLGAENFLRIALHLGPAELQTACWFGPGGDGHTRLKAALQAESPVLTALRSMEPEPLLWLWSPQGEQRIPLHEIEPGQVAGLDWDRYTVALQTSRPFAELAGEGLVERVAGWVSEMLEPLRPVLTGVVH
ncbi:MAG: hypothetical protein ACOY94_17445 [Bacillota bacterium]